MMLEMFRQYELLNFDAVLLKGYSAAYNSLKDYRTAKEPCHNGFMKENYVPPVLDDIMKWCAADGWVGWVVAPGYHIIDTEVPYVIKIIEFLCRKNDITPAVNITNRGRQYVFTSDAGLLGESEQFTTLGVPVTYRASGRNYVIQPPINGRTWLNYESLANPPKLSDELLPYESKDPYQVGLCLSYTVGEAYLAKQLSGDVDVDMSFMAFLIEEGFSEEQISDFFHLVFRDEFDSRRTAAMYQRAKEKIASGKVLRGAGSFIHKIKEIDLKRVQRFIDELQRLKYPGKRKKKAPEDPKIVLKANFPGLIDLVDDDGVPAFLVLHNNKLEVYHTINTESAEGEKITVRPPGYTHFSFRLAPAEEVKNWFQANDDNLFNDVLAFLRPCAYLTDEQWLICAMYVLLTWIHDHRDIRYIPMLLFYAVQERGKSRTGKAMLFICYRGVHCVDLRETNLFRYSEELHATLFLDMMNLWKKAEHNQSEDVLLGRYERSATVARVLWPEKGPFLDTKHYAVYGPTLMASNEPIHNILDSRCITFHMQNKPAHYRNPLPSDGLPLKARLTAWRAKSILVSLPTVEPIEGITGRLWDIARPLFQICLMVAPDRYGKLIQAILNIATDRKQEKQLSDDGKIVRILKDLSPDDLFEWEILTSDITEEFNKDRKPEWHKSPNTIGRRLRALGVKTKIKGGVSHAFLNRDMFNILLDQYDLLTPEDSHESHENKQKPDITNDLYHDIQHDIQNAKSMSCSMSCTQVDDNIKVSGIHDIHDPCSRQEKVVIKVLDIVEAAS